MNDANAAPIPESTCPRCGATLNAGVASGLCPACLLRQAALETGTDSIPATPWTPPTVSELADAFPQLKVLDLIGHGGMGAVYKARQKSLGRLVALKILAPQHADNPDFADRFSREGKILAEVNHPGIVTVHDFGRAGEFYFLLMEFVDGVNLRQAMTAGRLTPQQALAIVPPICEALQFAHNRGIVHRDIKPENLLLDKDGRVKIADFGIARMLRNSTAEFSSDHRLTVPDVDLTQESVLGTPRYMAPEQREHPTEVDHRADIYSLGVVLYEMLTGELPGPALQAPSRRVQIDVRLDEIVLRALDARPEQRFATASEFREEVERLSGVSTIDTSSPVPVASKSGSPFVPRSCRCYITTPDRMATISGQIFLWRSHGQLLVDATQLVVTQGASILSIPLKSIRGLEIGCYPLLVNPFGLHFIRVSYDVEGADVEGSGVETQPRQIILSPHEGLIGLPTQFNDLVDSWHDVIEEALTAATGEAPAQSSRPVPEPATRSWLGIAMLILPPVAVALLCLVGLILMRGFEAENPTPDGISARGGISWGTILLCLSPFPGLLVPLLFVLLAKAKNRRYQALRDLTADSSSAAASPAPNSTSQTRENAPFRIGFDFQTRWGHRFARLSMLGFLGCLGFLAGPVGMPRLEGMFGFFGFFGFIGIAAMFEHRIRRAEFLALVVAVLGVAGLVGAAVIGLDRSLAVEQPVVLVLTAVSIIGVLVLFAVWIRQRRIRDASGAGTSKRRFSRLTLVLACLAFGVAVLVITRLPFEVGQVRGHVTTRHEAVDGHRFSFEYSAEIPPGWNVWLTLENAQLVKVNDSPTEVEETQIAPVGPQIVSRYQAKLDRSGRASVPLDYLPETDERRSSMRSSIGPWEGYTSNLRPNVQASLLAYTTESLVRVGAILWLLPEGQSPDSLLDTSAVLVGSAKTDTAKTVRYQTVPPPQPVILAPFNGAYRLGRVELAALGPQPLSADSCWRPNGEPATDLKLPESGGSSSASGQVIRELAVRVFSETGQPSQPVLRFPGESKINGMGRSFHGPTETLPFSTLIQTIACPLEAKQMTVEVGVADGDWQNTLAFERRPSQRQFSAASGDGKGTVREGSVRVTETVDGTVAVAFSYSKWEDAETRLVYEQIDGTIVALKEEGASTNHGLLNALTVLPAEKFEMIRRFHLQSRRYEWIEFQNVSLDPAHRTRVAVQGVK